MKFNRVFFLMLVASLAVLLTACGAPPASNWPGLASDGTHVYLADGQYVYNILLSDGTEATLQTADGLVPARFPLKADASKTFYAPPALTADGQLLIGSAAAAKGAHPFFSINPATGNESWSFTAVESPWVAGALVLDNTIYAPGGDGKLYAFSPSGEKLWDFSASNHGLWTAPITDGKLIYLATLGHEVFALDPRGKQVWNVKLDNGIIGAPSYADGVLYVGTLSGNMYALSAADGSQKWVKMLEGGIWGTPATDGTNVYIGTVKGSTGMFYILSAATGQVVDSRPEAGSIIAGPLLTADQVIYGTEAGHIQSLDKTGAPKWQDTIENAKLYTPPFLAGDLVLIAPMNAKFLLRAYDINGVEKWTFVAK